MKALFIDVDGTIINSFPGITASLCTALTEYGWPLPTDDQLRRVLGPPLKETLASYGMSEQEVNAVFSIYRREYDDTGWSNATLFDGWKESLEAWRDQGFTLCTATSKADVVAQRMLEHLGIAHLFDFIGGSALDGTRPTKAEVIAWVLDQMELRGQESSILMIGDRSHDTEGAAIFHIPTALVGWGHGNDAEFNAAAYFAPTMEDLRNVVHQHFSADQ